MGSRGGWDLADWGAVEVDLPPHLTKAEGSQKTPLRALLNHFTGIEAARM